MEPVEITEDDLRRTALARVLALALAMTALGVVGPTLAINFAPDPPPQDVRPLFASGLVVLGLAWWALRNGQVALATRTAIVTWLVMNAGSALTSEPAIAMAVTPVSFAVGIGFATVFDRTAVLQWSLVAAILWAAVALARPPVIPEGGPPAELAALLPALMLGLLGWASAVVVGGRDVAFRRAREGDRALAAHVAELDDKRRQLEVQRQAMLDALCDVHEARAASKAKSAFLARMSHELRTPLNAIIGYAELMVEEADGDATDAERVVESGRHLLELINDVLDLSKVEAGQLELSPRSFALESWMDELIGWVRPLVEANGNRFVVERHFEVEGPFFGDEVRMRQILLNLLSNAAKFTEHGTVTVTARRADGELVFIVVDTGIGIARDDLERIFQPFEQVDTTTTRRFGGTGLGLAICRQFGDLMGADLDVVSEVGRGSTFVFRMPDRPRSRRSAKPAA